MSPSLYDRDAYQSELRQHPERRSGLRFDVHWKTSLRGALTLRFELQGAREEVITSARLEARVQKSGWFRQWTILELKGEDYRSFGELVAWRATLWDGDRQVGQAQSFLW